MTSDIKTPVNWKQYSINDIGNIITGSTPPTNTQKYYNGERLFISPSDIGNTKYIVKTEKHLSDDGLKISRVLPKYAIVVTCIGELGKTGITTTFCTTNQQINSVICNPNVMDSEFFYYCISYNKNKLNIVAGLQVIPIVNKSLFSKIQFIAPISIPEQQKIAEVLTTIDNVIEKTEQLIEKLKNIKKGLMQDLFTRGVTSDGKLRPASEVAPELYKESELGLIPKEWEVVRLDTIAKVIDPHPSHRAPSEHDDGYPFAGIGDIEEDGTILLDKCRKVSLDSIEKQRKTYSFSDGDIGFGRVATIGKVIRLRSRNTPFALSPTMAVIRSITINYNYLIYYLQSNVLLEQIDSLLTGSTRSSLGIMLLRQLKTLLPSENELNMISILLTNHNNVINIEEHKLFKLKLIKKGLMDDLLTGKVRVNSLIDVK